MDGLYPLVLREVDQGLHQRVDFAAIGELLNPRQVPQQPDNSQEELFIFQDIH